MTVAVKNLNIVVKQPYETKLAHQNLTKDGRQTKTSKSLPNICLVGFVFP